MRTAQMTRFDGVIALVTIPLPEFLSDSDIVGTRRSTGYPATDSSKAPLAAKENPGFIAKVKRTQNLGGKNLP